MLTEIKLKNFKCFKDMVSIPVNQINLFTGINGRGKSTALQALLLMRQSPEHSRTTDKIIFNGSCIELGNFKDVKNSSIPPLEPIEFIFKFENNSNNVELHYFFKENEKDDLVANIEKVNARVMYDNNDYEFSIEEKDGSQGIFYDNCFYVGCIWHNLLFNDGMDTSDPFFLFVRENVEFSKIHYISADRIGPQDYYPKQSFTEFPNVGPCGEYTANLLSQKKTDPVNKELCFEAAPYTILDQTEAWLSAIFYEGKIRIKSLEANIVIMEMNSDNSQNLYKPINVGFGYSYVLPILVSGLAAKKGDILIVENPEAHLHPYAQSQIGKFLAKVSGCGVQVFVESHSDHILNALRISVQDKIINPDDLKIIYFPRDKNNQILQVPVDSDGSIENWPKDFFDQTEKDFEKLFGV